MNLSSYWKRYVPSSIHHKNTIATLTLRYGICLAAFLLLMHWIQIHFLLISYTTDLYIGIIALIFTLLGIWLAVKLQQPTQETIVIEQQVFVQHDSTPLPSLPLTTTKSFLPDEQQLIKTGLSPRELEVLRLMADGLSNQEIAATLFLSLNTIKTHASNIFLKMDVKRRTQAVDKARKLGIVL